MPLSRHTMPSSGMTLRTSCTMRCGVAGKRSSSARSLMCSRTSLPNPRKARATIPDHLGMRKVRLLGVGRRVGHMDDLRALGTHQKRRLFHGVVTDRNDEIGMVDCAMHIIAG